MLTIEIKDKQLTTKENFTIQIEEQNPATDFENVPGAKAIGIELPQNDTNRNYLNNPDRFEKMGSINDRKFSNAVLRHFGQIIQKGTLIIDEATNKNYSGWLRGLIGNLAERVAGKYINQTNLGGVKTFVNKLSFDPLVDEYATPKIFNWHFWRDSGKRIQINEDAITLEGEEFTQTNEVSQLTKYFYDNEEFFINFPTASGVKTDGLNTAPVVTPMLFLHRLIELILSDNYIFVKENFLKSDTNLQKLILYNNFSILKTSIETTLRQLHITSPFQPGLPLVIEYPAEVIKNYTFSADTFQYADLIPKMKSGDFVLSIQNLLNVIFSFNDLNECRIYDRNKLLTDQAFDVDQYMIGEWELGERKDVTVKLSMEHDKQDYAFTDNWEDLSDLRHKIEDPVALRSDLDLLTPELDEIRKVISENAYYQYHWHVIAGPGSDGKDQEEDILGWEMITIGFQPYFFNDGFKEIEEIKTKFSTIQLSRYGYPLVMQKGNSEAFRSQPEEFSPRLLFYLGNEVASYRSGTLDIDWDGENGLVAKRWKNWLEFWANRLPAKATFKFPASVFYYIKNNKAILPLRTRHGSFIIDKIEAVASRQDTIETTLHVFKRERVLSFESGSVPGGEEPSDPDTFTPIYLGISTTGRPYLIDVNKASISPPAWGPFSEANFSETTCADYYARTKFLFVGSKNGRLWIHDLSDPENMRVKSIQVIDAEISAVRVLEVSGGALGTSEPVILIAKNNSNEIYRQPWHMNFNDYTNYEAVSFGNLTGGYLARDFVFADDYYYACTKWGEIFRRWVGGSSWTEIMDRDADFTHMAVTENYIWVFDNSDRNFRAHRSNPLSWSEFDIIPNTGALWWKKNVGTSVKEAVPLTGNRVLTIVTNEDIPPRAYIVTHDQDPQQYSPQLASGGKCGGSCRVGSLPVVSIEEGTGATKLAAWSPAQNKWAYINVPAFFSKLFYYQTESYSASDTWSATDFINAGFIINWES